MRRVYMSLDLRFLYFYIDFKQYLLAKIKTAIFHIGDIICN